MRFSNRLRIGRYYTAIAAVALLSAGASVASAQTPPKAVDSPFQVRYAANLPNGESYVDIINTGANGAPSLGPGFGANNIGNICVNVYVLDPVEELIACCSCLITPNQTVNMGLKSGVLGNTLTPAIPTSVTIKLVGSAGAATGNAPSNCTNSAATAGSTFNPLLTGGFVAFGTSIHTTSTVGKFSTTETPFMPVGLSSGELASLTGRCAFILGNGSGYGICNGCRLGALGAAKH